jgi:aspartyl aminopeptidase
VLSTRIDPNRSVVGHDGQHVDRASAQGLCEFIDASPSPFHVCATAAARLTAAGTASCPRPTPGREGPVLHGAARVTGGLGQHRTPGRPFRIVGGHTDSPNLRVKQHPDRVVAAWQVVALQPYGGAWLNSWLDRDLGVSGRLSVSSGAGIAHHHGRIDEPVLQVPQLAIHLAEDRAAVNLDPQRHVNAVWGTGENPRSFVGSSPNAPGSTRRRPGLRPDDP